MSLEFYYHKIKKAHKQHDCEMCGQKIEVGENYSYASGKYDGEFFERKLHQKCEDVLNEVLLDTGENEFDYEMIQEWWKEEKCEKCKHRYPECDAKENGCVYSGDCNYLICGKCTIETDCDKMDRSCWCTLFEVEEA